MLILAEFFKLNIMSYKVCIDVEAKTVVIGEALYTIETLEAKTPKTQFEYHILTLIKRLF